ncbi:MAG: hypothetical protein ACKPFJ_05860, partial [Dolichospermum sp.]
VSNCHIRNVGYKKLSIFEVNWRLEPAFTQVKTTVVEVNWRLETASTQVKTTVVGFKILIFLSPRRQTLIV